MKLYILALLVVSVVAPASIQFLNSFYCPEEFHLLQTNTHTSLSICIKGPKKTATLLEAIDICRKFDSNLASAEVVTAAAGDSNNTIDGHLFWVKPFETKANLFDEKNTFPAVLADTKEILLRPPDAYLWFLCVKQSGCNIDWHYSRFLPSDEKETTGIYQSRCCSFPQTDFDMSKENVLPSACLFLCHINKTCTHLFWRANKLVLGVFIPNLNGTCYLSSKTPKETKPGEAGTFCAYKKEKPETHIDHDPLEEETRLCLNKTDELHHYTKCFILHAEWATYFQAQKKCKQHLATLNTEEEYMLISRLMKGSVSTAAWVSLELNASQNWSWSYMDKYEKLTYGDWLQHPKLDNIRNIPVYEKDKEWIRKRGAVYFPNRGCDGLCFTETPSGFRNYYLCETRTIIADNDATKQQLNTNHGPIIALTSVVVGILFIGLVILSVWLRKMYQNNQMQESALTQLYHQLNRKSEFNSYVPYSAVDPTKPLDRQVEQLTYQPSFEISRELIHLGEKIGSGMFGVVYKGYLRKKGAFSTDIANSRLPIAIKGPSKDGHQSDVQLAFKMLVDEIKIMSSIGKHPNVLAFIGANTKKLPKTIAKAELYMFVEYCDHGNLKSFLKPYLLKERRFVDELRSVKANEDGDYVAPKNVKVHKYANEEDEKLGAEAETERLLSNTSSLTTSDLICFALQIAEGMDFIANIPCVHRDLAARNVLVTHNQICKVADFGLAKETKEKDYYRARKEASLPIRWMPIEAIKSCFFTTESDMWSYGVVLFEIFSLGAHPYSSIESTASLPDLLKRGYRLSQPEYCHNEIYDLMKTCWNEKPTERPTFAACAELMKSHLERSSPQLAARIHVNLSNEMERLDSLSNWTNATDVATTQI